jgi:hypothetical protein
VGIYDKRYHIRDIRWGWTDAEIMENERMIRQERIAQVYRNDRYVAKEDYSTFFDGTVPKIPTSLCRSIFFKKVMKWLVG